MSTAYRGSATLVWWVLLLITAGSWAVGAHVVLGETYNHTFTVTAILLLACIKMRLVIRHFMEVKIAPPLLKYLSDLWLVAMFLSLLWLYL